MSEKTRSDFEAFDSAEHGLDRAFYTATRTEQGYRDYPVQARWATWLSSRRQALEEAAAICEEQVCSASMFASAREAEDRRNTLAWAASAIRREADPK